MHHVTCRSRPTYCNTQSTTKVSFKSIREALQGRCNLEDNSIALRSDAIKSDMTDEARVFARRAESLLLFAMNDATKKFEADLHGGKLRHLYIYIYTVCINRRVLIPVSD